MRLRHFFFAAMLIGGFAACSDEENLGGVDNGSSEVNAYMTLQIVGPQGMGTKTDGDPNGDIDPNDPESGDYVTGTDAENKISSVTVLLCNTNNQTVSYIYDISDLETLSNGGVRTPVIATTTGEYSVYVIANRPSSLSISAGDDVNEKLIEYVSESSMKETYAKDNSFLMFSECNGTDKIGGTSISITSSNDYDHPATCETIELDRLAVKIKSQAENVDITEITKEDGEFNAISSIVLQGFKLVNGATGAYLQQHWSNATTEQGNYPWYSQLNTPNLTNSSTG